MTTLEWTEIVGKGYKVLADKHYSGNAMDYIGSTHRNLKHLFAHAWAEGYKACLEEMQDDSSSD